MKLSPSLVSKATHDSSTHAILLPNYRPPVVFKLGIRYIVGSQVGSFSETHPRSWRRSVMPASGHLTHPRHKLTKQATHKATPRRHHDHPVEYHRIDGMPCWTKMVKTMRRQRSSVYVEHENVIFMGRVYYDVNRCDLNPALSSPRRF